MCNNDFASRLKKIRDMPISSILILWLFELVCVTNSSNSQSYPGWSPRGNQRWTALFHSFFSADSENMINISADQLCFRADQLWFSLNQRCSKLKNSALFQSWTALFQRQTALNQRCSALIFLALKHRTFSAEQRWFSLDLLWISSDSYTCRWDYQNMIT